MLLSRAFCLILGTTLFVLIWTMQDGNHRSTRVARHSRSRFAGPLVPTPEPAISAAKTQPEKIVTISTVSTSCPAVAKATVTNVVPQPVVKKSAESMLWMFADESVGTQATQIAGK
jgi:hypothetical protein